MELRLLMVGRTDRGPVSDLVTHYLGRLPRGFSVEQTVLPEAGKGEVAYRQRVECDRIMSALKPGERVVVLDERGTPLTSVGFAGRLGAWRDQGVRKVVFVVGGAYGMTDEVRERADLVLALSAMTFPHQLVRVLFAEQLYRATAILQGSPYHH